MTHRCIATAILTCLALGVGCQTSRTASVSVELHNASDQPVTAWITKTGARDGLWLAPEDLALAAKPDSLNGVVIPPGKTGEIGPLKGRFEPEASAILRVYAGQLDYDHILATSVSSPLRVDVALDDGMNRLEVRPGAKLDVAPVGAK